MLSFRKSQILTHCIFFPTFLITIYVVGKNVKYCDNQAWVRSERRNRVKAAERDLAEKDNTAASSREVWKVNHLDLVLFHLPSVLLAFLFFKCSEDLTSSENHFMVLPWRTFYSLESWSWSRDVDEKAVEQEKWCHTIWVKSFDAFQLPRWLLCFHLSDHDLNNTFVRLQ